MIVDFKRKTITLSTRVFLRLIFLRNSFWFIDEFKKILILRFEKKEKRETKNFDDDDLNASEYVTLLFLNLFTLKLMLSYY